MHKIEPRSYSRIQRTNIDAVPGSLPEDASTAGDAFTTSACSSTSAVMPRTKENVTTMVTYYDIVFNIISIIGRISSILLNIKLAIEYNANQQPIYFMWTICCIIIPACITIILSVTMYVQDHKEKNMTTIKTWSEIVCFVMIFPFLFRYCQSLSYAIASKRAERRNDKDEQKKYYEFMIQEDSDVAFIRIFECFLEAAPQKILQLAIVLRGETELTTYQVLSILNSIVSMTWCMASYYRCVRFSQPDKMHVSTLGTAIQCCWHFCITVSRILSIAIIASVFVKSTLVACSVHAIGMALWIFIFDRSKSFCASTVLNSLSFSIILGIVYIFTYILSKDGRPTFMRYLVFYTICAIENILCVIFFIIYIENPTIKTTPFYFILLCTLAIIPFGFGILCMVIYYSFFHPNLTCRKELKRTVNASNNSISIINHDEENARV